MKIIFNDASELIVQSASIRADGSLLIKTISATEEELRTMFQDKFKTQKMTVTERESKHVDNLTEANKSREAENAELIATVDSILTDVLPALLGDGTEETDTK